MSWALIALRLPQNNLHSVVIGFYDTVTWHISLQNYVSDFINATSFFSNLVTKYQDIILSDIIAKKKKKFVN